MSAHVLLSLINELGKVIKCEASQVYKFKKTGARMLDSTYHMFTHKNCLARMEAS